MTTQPPGPGKGRTPPPGRGERLFAAAAILFSLAAPNPVVRAAAAPVVPPPVLQWKSDRQQYRPFVDARTHQQMLMIDALGHAVVWADVLTRAGTIDHYEIHADSIRVIPSGSGQGLSEADAEGNVRLVARTPLTDATGHPAGVRALLVTGARAHYDGATQIAAITGDPHMEVLDPQVVGPMTLTNAARVSVDLRSQTYDITGAGGQQPTVRLEPRSGSAPAVPPGAGKGNGG